jgi:hypothetical protein
VDLNHRPQRPERCALAKLSHAPQEINQIYEIISITEKKEIGNNKKFQIYANLFQALGRLARISNSKLTLSEGPLNPRVVFLRV